MCVFVCVCLYVCVPEGRVDKELLFMHPARGEGSLKAYMCIKEGSRGPKTRAELRTYLIEYPSIELTLFLSMLS